jgi:hypothetical protein
MFGFSIKLSKKFSLDVSFFHVIRQFKDGITFFDLVCNLDLYKGDHNPKSQFMLVLLNFKVFEIEIYCIDHVL